MVAGVHDGRFACSQSSTKGSTLVRWISRSLAAAVHVVLAERNEISAPPLLEPRRRRFEKATGKPFEPRYQKIVIGEQVILGRAAVQTILPRPPKIALPLCAGSRGRCPLRRL